MDTIDSCLALIEEGRFSEAAQVLAREIEDNGLTEKSAIIGATLNSCIGNSEGCLAMIKAGLNINPANYELHLMLADYYAGFDIIQALTAYDNALAYARFELGVESEDYKYIRSVRETFVSDNKQDIFDYIDSLPILIYKSEPICFGVLNHFADMLAGELAALGNKIEIIDVNDTPVEEIAGLTGKRYKAIIGIQTYIFSVLFKDGRNIHDFIFGPKFNMIFDHPCCMYKHLSNAPYNHTVLTHDRNYLRYIQDKFPNHKVAIIPPAGEECDGATQRDYDISFIGSYKSPNTWDGVIAELDSKYSGAAQKLVSYMKQNPNDTYESCLELVLGEGQPAGVYYDLKQTYFNVMSYYREKILLALLDSGLQLHVFGDSFDVPVFKKYDNLIVHDELTPEESLLVYKKSKMSLNIMSWHKDGRTERVCNAMLNGSLVVSDKCDYLVEEYSDKALIFDLEDIDGLPNRIKDVLNDEKALSDMASKAYEKASEEETWTVRARDFLNVLEDTEV